MSPYLFVLAKEIMTTLISQATNSEGFSYHWKTKDIGLTHLTFADDVFLFCKGDKYSIEYMLAGIEAFAKYSGLMLNGDKSHCFFNNVPQDVQQFTISTSGFQLGVLPIKYHYLFLQQSSTRDTVSRSLRVSAN